MQPLPEPELRAAAAGDFASVAFSSHGDATLDGAAAWIRLSICVLTAAVGGVAFWSVVVVLPEVQAEFGSARGEASLAYSANMIGFALGGIFMGRLADRRGIAVPVAIGGVALGAGYALAALAPSLWSFVLIHGALIGFLGGSASFGPLVADVSHWFRRRRGIAMAICASGNYVAGAVWPPLIRYAVDLHGWRAAHFMIAAICVAAILPLAWMLRHPAPHEAEATAGDSGRDLAAISPNRLQAILALAGVSCCIAMAMPQVHIVAYCADLGFELARGAEMLSLMLAAGVASRLISGWISDRIGGVRTLLLGALLQTTTLALYIPFDGLASLYLVSFLFGLSQGGIVPSYALIVRESLPAREAGARVGTVLMATIVGMALGGWLSGLVYDVAGSYRAAFLNGIAWNLVTVATAVWLVRRLPRPA
jgi:MFS family permease